MSSENSNEAASKPNGGGGSKKKSLNKKTASSNKLNELDYPNDQQTLSIVRETSSSVVGSRNILTAYYGARGERIRHTVHDSALQMPSASWDIINQVIKGTEMEPASKYTLPPLDGVLRPCIDPTITELTVTSLEIEKVEIVQPKSKADPASLSPGQDPPELEPTVIKVLQTKVQNRVIRRTPVTVKDAAEAERIRGGGGGDNEIISTSGEGQQPIEECSVEEDTGNPQHLDTNAAEEETAITQPEDQSASMDMDQSNKESTVDAIKTDDPLQQPTAETREGLSESVAPPDSNVTTTTTSETSATIHAPLTMEAPQTDKAVDEPMAMEIEPSHNETTAADSIVTTETTSACQTSPRVHDKTPTDPSVMTSDTAVADPSSSLSQGPALESASPTPTTTTSIAPSVSAPTIATTVDAPVPAATTTPLNTDSQDIPSIQNQASSSVVQESVAPKAPAMTQTQARSIGKVLPPAPAPSTTSADAVLSATDKSENFVKSEEESKEESQKHQEKWESPPAQSLTTKPEPEWEQHKPVPHDETVTPVDQLPQRPKWYEKDSISDIERSMLPEWFDSSSPHRTPESYLETREKIIKMSDTLANRNLTNAMIRRVVVGDAGSLQRLRTFLVNWGVINEDSLNDSAPTPSGLRPSLKRPKQFSEDMRGNLISAVVEQAKRRKLGHDDDGDQEMGGDSSSSSSFVPIDWDEVAMQLGHGTSAEDCQQNFLMESLPKDEPTSTAERSITPDATQESSKSSADEAVSAIAPSSAEVRNGETEKELVRKMIEESNPNVLRAMVDAAIKATDGNVVESQAAAVVGLQLTRAIEEARGYEVELAARLSKLVDVRMQKLENRMGMMDDVEGILEAEKVALELERRDLYTARCRHWFGGL
ncbi:SWIM zinc finger domain protein [Nitzschia inconspicua]|uniref:SWIM zinc finger domain protein n=1 Tax=Nitzschia inconspicua TaxID=303405 RepID=A0A9K3LLR8_9STRA|nr:SWIM zinc finger domain protein [Nitzschia inconspicua]